MLTPTALTKRRERSMNGNDKEQSGAETVKIPARLLDPYQDFDCSSPRDGAILQ
jgi:hypothetical protein